MKIYNTLTQHVDEFVPIHKGKVGMYTCGPTVYDYAHIGNWRTYTTSDILRRTLEYLGNTVTAVSNITDVGHLVSDSDEGEDKLEKGAKREGKTAWDVAKKYTDLYLEHEKLLNILPPAFRCKATDYIKQQIELIQKLESRGFTYKTSDGIYFDTSKLSDYGKLTPRQNKEELKEGARVEVNTEKKHPTDFALWKFSPKDGTKRDMQWESPWGVGFPGWHIECSAMGMTHLGEQFDIHVGGSDLKNIHHNNEIAQSEAATGKVPFVKYWVHGEFLMVNGEKMSKSKGNFYNLSDIIAKGFDPLSLRYLFFTTHYRSFLNFTWEGLTAAQTALQKLRIMIQSAGTSCDATGCRNVLSQEKMSKIQDFSDRFTAAIENDLRIPEALAVFWEAMKSNIPETDKVDLAHDLDQVLGLNLFEPAKGRSFFEGPTLKDLPTEIQTLVSAREDARKQQDWKKADELRQELLTNGWTVEDTTSGPTLRKS